MIYRSRTWLGSRPPSAARLRRARLRRVGVSVMLVAGVVVGTTTIADASSLRPAQASADSTTVTVLGLREGAEGPGVLAVQQKLIGFGYYVAGGADGRFGRGTTAALRVFQGQNGLNPTGVVTENTARYLGFAGGVVTAAAAPTATTAAAGAGAPAATPAATGSAVGLRRGAHGPTVKLLQERILATGLVLRGGADGVFGPSTERMLKLVQRVNGLPETGVVDARTAQVLGITAGGGSPASPASPAPAAAVVQYGMRGSAVKRIQQLLIKAGITVRGGADGIFGAHTRAAVRAFQQSKGLGVTGVVDAATDAALVAAAAGTPAAPATPATPATPAATSYVGLRLGSQGPAVKAVQQALQATGLYVRGGADGVFGTGTRSALVIYQRVNGLTANGVVTAATARLMGLGGTAQPAAPATPAPATPAPAAPAVRLQAKPVAGGRCYYVDTWQANRGGGRVHLGVDIGAPEGTPLRAVVTGRVTQIYRNQARAGNGIKIATADGTYFFYAHLAGFAPGIGLGVPVTAGQVIGYVGRTGNAGISHLHLEVHPRGGAAINPYPLVQAIGAC